MKTHQLPLAIIVALLLALCLAPVPTALAQDRTSTAPESAAEVNFVCSEGDSMDDCTDGTLTIVGTATSGNVVFMPDLFPNPSVVLIDISTSIGGDYESFVPETGQILGLLTTPLFPGPGELLIRLPISPTAASIDLDNDGAEDPGVQIYALNVASNLINDSYLQQLEQGDGLGSYLVDVTTGPLPRAAL